MILALSAVWTGTAAPPRPNLLFILTDDQRFDAAGYLGHPFLKTPNLDRLAAEGVRFPNAFVTTPICAASRASILTGRYERAHHFNFGTPPLAERFCESSYPALLRQAGYRTGLIGKYGISTAKGENAKMFDVLSPIGYPFLRKQPNGETRHIDQIATDRAIEFLEQQPADQPFCLSVSFNSPHAEDGSLDNLYPWPSTVDGLYDDVPIAVPPPEEERIFNAEPAFLQKAMNRIRWFWQFDTPEKYVKNVRSYYRMISGIDHEIGRLTSELDKLGLAKNTVLVFMSDNGYFLGERGFSGKWVHYEESLRVPLLVIDPRHPEQKGRSVEQMALNLDIAPTLLEYAGVQLPKGFQGRSLVPLAQGKKPSWRKDFLCEHLLVNPDIPKWEGVRGERTVYARYFEQEPVFEFLHDLKQDPRELRNLANDPGHGKTLDQMRKRLGELVYAAGG
ncbi:MAG: sulfatase [Fimbriimonadaceae bacterium]|nr:sulfatase [Fimbriimonadaceae bacterium]